MAYTYSSAYPGKEEAARQVKEARKARKRHKADVQELKTGKRPALMRDEPKQDTGYKPRKEVTAPVTAEPATQAAPTQTTTQAPAPAAPAAPQVTPSAAPANMTEMPDYMRPAHSLDKGLAAFGQSLLRGSDWGTAIADGFDGYRAPMQLAVENRNNQLLRDQRAQKLAEGGRYTPESIEKYRLSGNTSVLQPIPDKSLMAAGVKAQAKAGEELEGYQDDLAELKDIRKKIDDGTYDTGPIEGSAAGIWTGELWGSEDASNLREMESRINARVDKIMNERSGTQTDKDELRAMRQEASATNSKDANLKILDRMINKVQLMERRASAKAGVPVKSSSPTGNTEGRPWRK